MWAAFVKFEVVATGWHRVGAATQPYRTVFWVWASTADAARTYATERVGSSYTLTVTVVDDVVV